MATWPVRPRPSSDELLSSWLLRIAAEYAQEVFGMFRRLHGGNRYPGTGIGLALVRRVIEAHGGKVWVETKPGAGCTFRFTLPDQVS